jgi:hypothetical protein
MRVANKNATRGSSLALLIASPREERAGKYKLSLHILLGSNFHYYLCNMDNPI